MGSIIDQSVDKSQRAELLVAIRQDISLTPQLGRHYYTEFLRNPPRGQEERRSSLITRAKYESDDQILGKGEGWKQGQATLTFGGQHSYIYVVFFPSIEMASIRRHKFAEPYPSPGIPVVPPKMNPILDVKEEKKDVKPQMVDVKPQVKHEFDSAEVKQEIKAEAPLEDVNPTIMNSPSVHKPSMKDNASSASVKQDPGSSATFLFGSNPLIRTPDMISHTVKQEPQGPIVKEGEPRTPSQFS